MVENSSYFGPNTSLKKSKIPPFPHVFYPPKSGSYESLIKTGSDELCLIRIKWLKTQVISVQIHTSKSKILPFPYVFYPPKSGSFESPIKTGSDELCSIQKKLRKQCF